MCRLSTHKSTLVYFKASKWIQSRIPTLTHEPDHSCEDVNCCYPKASFPGRNRRTLLEAPFWSSPVAFLKHKNTADWTCRTRDSAYNIKCTLNEPMQILYYYSYQQAAVYCLHLTMRSQMQVNVQDLQSFGVCSRYRFSGGCYSDTLYWHTTKDTEMQTTAKITSVKKKHSLLTKCC